MKKLWVISEFYYPIVTSTGYYMTEIAEYLAAKGIEVHVICTNACYNEKLPQFDIAKEEIHNNVFIHRTLTGTIDKNNFFKRTIRLLISSFRLFFKIVHKVSRGDVILIVTNPAFLLLAMPFVKFLKRTRYVLLVHDIFPENVLSIGKIKQSSYGYRVLKKIFDWAYSKADTCISIGRDMTEVIQSKTENSKSIVYIPNWADIVNVYPKAKEATCYYQQLNLEDKFIFQFAGNLGQVQGLDNILATIGLVDNPALHFLFIGSGAKENLIREFANKAPLHNVTFLGFQERHLQNEFLNMCDVALISLSDEIYGLGVPSKSYNIMAAGKPILIIADKDSEISRCVKEYQIGWVVSPNNPLLLKSTFEEIYRCKDLSTIGARSRKVAEEHFSKDVILEKYYRLLSAML